MMSYNRIETTHRMIREKGQKDTIIELQDILPDAETQMQRGDAE